MVDDETSPLLPGQVQANEDHATEQDEAENTQTSQHALTVIPLMLLGIFISNGDTFLVIATRGAIASELNDLEHSEWLVTGFFLAMCATQPLYGKLSDIFGRKWVLSFAYVLFIVGCLISGIGSTLGQIVAGRVISGAGGSGMISLVSVIIADMVPIRDIAAYRSYVNIAATTGRSLGGPIGGFLADTVGWRWSFYGQCPPLAISLALILWKMPSTSLTPHGQPEEDTAKSSSLTYSKLARIDFVGAILLAGTIITFLLILDLGRNQFPTHQTIIYAVLFVLFGLSFIWVESRWAREPIFPLYLLRNRDVVTSYLIFGLQFAAQSGIMFSVPIYFQITQNVTVAAAGARLVPAVVGNAIGGLLSGFVISKTGHYRLLSILGPVSSCIGFLLIILRWHGHTNIAELMYIIPGGFGAGIAVSTGFIQLAATLDPADMAIAGTSFYLSQNLGSTSGISLTETVMQATLRRSLNRSLAGNPKKDEIIEKSVSSLASIRDFQGSIKDLVIRTYVSSLMYSHIVALSCSVLALAVSFFVREHKI